MLEFIRTRLPRIVVSHGVGVNSSPVLVSSPSSSPTKRFLDIPRAYLANEIPTRERREVGKNFSWFAKEGCRDLGRYSRNRLRKCHSSILRARFSW